MPLSLQTPSLPQKENPVTAPDASAQAPDLPEDWTSSASGTFEAILEERPDLSATEEAALWEACCLISAADRLDEVARAAGYVSTGSTGQVVAHPAVVEARLARTAAATILARLVPTKAGAKTDTERARAAARARWERRRA